jgi:hypothetical protein
VKFTPIVILCAGAFALAGCQHQLTLEEAQAACTKQGGFLVVFYSQKITTAGLGPQIATPGNCVSAGKFDKTPAASAPAAPPSAPTSGAAQSRD